MVSIEKRYLVFEHEAYYPGGGWNDFVAAYATLEEAKAHCAGVKYGNCEVVDVTTLTVVWEN